jgi:hypothetical protein
VAGNIAHHPAWAPLLYSCEYGCQRHDKKQVEIMISPHDDGDLFDELYPPNYTLTKSNEYDTEDGQAGMYGRSPEDRAIVMSVPYECVWSIVEYEGGLYASPGFRVVNWLYYYVSSVPRDPSAEDRDYQLTEEIEDDDGNNA